MSSQFKGISKAAQHCLSSGENARVEFKEKAVGLGAEDLVAFANSKDGGTILIGVREATGTDGTQIGISVGHKIDDESKLQIMSKALSCVPPVQIEIAIENLKSKPFFRVEVPSSPQKPHSTQAGIYKIREDGRNAPLHPEPLLKMFLEREGEEFKKRFSEATAQIDRQMVTALANVKKLEETISSKIEKIGSDLGWADSRVGETSDAIDDVQAYVSALTKETREQTERIRAIIKKVDATDPVKQRAAEKLRKAIVEQLKRDPSLLKNIREGKGQLSLQGKDMSEFDQEEAQRIFMDALTSITKEAKNAPSE